jgi:hypothetical protein
MSDDMTGEFRVNGRRAVRTLRIGREASTVIVVDDYLAEPRALVDFAASQARFGMPKNWYPGLRAEPLPQAYVIETLRSLHRVIGETFGLPVEGSVHTNTYFGLATIAPADLSPLQRFPHFDTPNPRQIALLHYLCDASHGGTAFFRHRATGFETMSDERVRPYFDRLDLELRERGPRPARYTSGDDDMFEEIGRIDATFNRLIVYRSCVLHSADVNAALGLSPDPRAGRLTANTFITYR